MNGGMADNFIDKAFSLAFFIHGDKETAVRIVVAAMTKLEVALTAQYKRLYYQPTGRMPERRHGPEGLRNKVSFSDLQLLQRLIFIESETYEKERERLGRAACREEDMVRFFIKHLVRITTRRNSFYVTLGISRLLYNFSTTEAMEIYNLLIQDPDRVKDDYYFRSRKAQLMIEIKDRFGDLIRVCVGPRGEKRFHSGVPSERLSALVTQCLAFFTPWDTKCVIPKTLDPSTRLIVRPAGQAVREEDHLELERIHAVLHPDCLSQVTRTLGLDQPSDRLRIPYFDLEQNGQHPPRDRGHQARLSPDEFVAIKAELAELATRRRASAAGLLRVFVDGTERGQIDLRRSRSTTIELDERAELIEVRAVDNDEVIMGSYLLTVWDDHERPPEPAGIILERGEKLTLSLKRAGEVVTAQINYSETRLLRAATLFINQTKLRFAQATNTSQLPLPWLVSPALAALLLIILAVGWLMYSHRHRPAELTQINNPAIVPVNNQPANDRAGAKVDEEPQGRRAPGSGDTAPRRHSTTTANRRSINPASLPEQRETTAWGAENRANESAAPEVTREIGSEPKAKTFNEVKAIYVDAVGSSRSATTNFQQKFLDELSRRTRYVVEERRQEADALLRLHVSNLPSHRVSVVVQLYDARGQNIWPGAGLKNKYDGPPDLVVKKIVEALIRPGRAR
jgi:hypothetical protein